MARPPSSEFGTNDDLAAYVPTPAEIRQGCQKIQATWTESQRRSRALGTRFVEPLGVTEIPWVGTMEGDGR